MAANEAWEKSQEKPVTLSHDTTIDIIKSAIDEMVVRCEKQGVIVTQEDCGSMFENMYEILKDYVDEWPT